MKPSQHTLAGPRRSAAPSSVATAVADQLYAQNANIVAHAAPGRDGLEQIVRWPVYSAPQQP